MVAYEIHPLNLQVISYRDREEGGWRRSALKPVQITIRDQCTPRDCTHPTVSVSIWYTMLRPPEVCRVQHVVVETRTPPCLCIKWI